jgi:PAS domain S-box-containing protein
MRRDETPIPPTSRSWSRAAVGAMTAGLVVVDPSLRIVLANPGAEKILGHPPDSLVGRRIEDVLGPLGDILSPEPRERGQKRIVRSDGMQITIGYSVSQLPGPARGDVHHVLLFQDITSYVEIRAERDRLLQLAAVGDVLPSLLHELRNPLASVTTSLEILVEDMDDGELRTTLHALLGELRRAQLTLQGIGTVGRDLATEGGHHAIDHALRDVCRVMDATAREAGVQLRPNIPDLPLLPLDAPVLRGVLFNLINNSIAATRGRGTVDVDVVLRRGELVVAVSDTGVGMTPEVLARCTDLFFTTKPRGSGIGLALAKQALESVGGALQIDSTPGRGTTVTLRIPLPERATGRSGRDRSI